MLKKHIISMFFCFSIALNGMESNNTNIEKNWFLYLPQEICNIIAHYLTFDDFETEEECVERTKELPAVPYSYYELINPEQFSFDLPSMKEATSSSGTLSALCPNKAKIIFLELLHGHKKLHVIDTQSKKIMIQNTPSREFFNISSDYKQIALSTDIDLFAIIKQKDQVDGEYYNTEITVQKIDCSEKQLLAFDHTLRFSDNYPIIAFNKQTTELIIHTNRNEYTMLTIPSAAVKQSPHKKTLKHYLFHQGILIKNWNCKKNIRPTILLSNQ